MKKQLFIFLTFLLTACHDGNGKLENALRLAGDNRPELERVLRHYAQAPADSLRLRAARFLIENMPGHYTLATPDVERLRKKIYADTSVCYLACRTVDIVLEQVFRLDHLTQKKEDIRHVSADFLIRHIDASFWMRETYPWLADVPFDTFLEYLLPHRIEHERLEPWRDSLFIAPTELQRLKAFDAYKHNFHVADLLPLPHGQKRLNNQDISRILDIQYDAKECADNARREIFRLRSIGIPAALDYVPAYANRNGEHHWFTIVGQDVLEVEFYRKVPKIYRFTYSHQPVPAPRDGEHIPSLFLNPFLKDVTGTYIETAAPAFDFSGELPRNARHAYLCVFNNFKWQPVAIAGADGGNAAFKDVGKNILYLPVAYQGREQTHLAHPFILNGEGEVSPLVPDTTRRLSVRLHRKYPTKKDFHWTIKIFPLMSVEASADASFSRPHTLERADTANYYYAEWKNSSPTPFRFWRINIEKFLGTPDFAELVFYDANGNPLRGKVDTRFAKAFDGDVLTNAAFDKEKEIRVDFGRPVAVSRVVLLPRGDGNGIYPGDEYELFYHDLDGWQSLGRRTATDYFLDYDNLPAGALYWLHNHTRGVEERPFTITPSGDIRFW